MLNHLTLLKPFEEVFDTTLGSPGGAPVEVYLRMVCLKLRWGLSYEEVKRASNQLRIGTDDRFVEVQEQEHQRTTTRQFAQDRLPSAGKCYTVSDGIAPNEAPA